MKFTIDQRNAASGAALVASILPSAETIPILKHVLLSGADGRLTISATDLDIFASVDAEAVIEDGEPITLEGQRFADMIASLPEGADIALATTESRANVIAGRSRFRFPTLPASDFPAIALEDVATVAMPAGTLASMIDRTIFICESMPGREHLSGIFVHQHEGALAMVSTNGHRMAVITSTIPFTGEAAILPKKTAALIQRIASRLEPETEIQFGFDYRRATFKAPGVVIRSKVLDGVYPDFRAIIPKNVIGHVGVDRGLFRDALRRADVALNRHRVVKVKVSAGQIALSARGESYAEASDELEADYDGEPFEINFQTDYLRDMLDKLGGDRLVMRFAGPRLAMVFVDGADATDIYLVAACG